MNPDVRLWPTEGMALHLTNGKPLPPGYAGGHYLPTFEQTQTGNPIEFNEIGGYDLAHTYIAYVERMHGWEKVLKLVRTGDYQGSLGVGEKEVYDAWTADLTHR